MSKLLSLPVYMNAENYYIIMIIITTDTDAIWFDDLSVICAS